MTRASWNSDAIIFDPFWLGLLILLNVIILISCLCCLRKKFGSAFWKLCRQKRPEIETHQIADKLSTYQWPSVYVPTTAPSPKLYKLLKTMKTVQMEKEQNNASTIPARFNDGPTILSYDCSPISKKITRNSLSTSNDRTSEVARKFYASMRKSSQCENFRSTESAAEEFSAADDDLHLFRTPEFFQSTPKTDGLTLKM